LRICCASRRRSQTAAHPGHGQILAKGADPHAARADLSGKATGLCSGKGGSMHTARPLLGTLVANAIVGAGLPLAARTALSAAYAVSTRGRRLHTPARSDPPGRPGRLHRRLSTTSGTEGRDARLPSTTLTLHGSYARRSARTTRSSSSRPLLVQPQGRPRRPYDVLPLGRARVSRDGRHRHCRDLVARRRDVAAPRRDPGRGRYRGGGRGLSRPHSAGPGPSCSPPSSTPIAWGGPRDHDVGTGDEISPQVVEDGFDSRDTPILQVGQAAVHFRSAQRSRPLHVERRLDLIAVPWILEDV